MLRTKKNKKKIVKVNVVSTSANYETELREFDIPDGGRCEIETIGGKFKVYDKDDDIIVLVNWQAGFTQSYSFEYKDN